MPSRSRCPSIAAPAALALAFVVAACGADAPTVAPPSGTTPSPSWAAATPAVAASPGTAGPGVTGGGATGSDLVTAAYEAGTIDRATGLLYRLQAATGDDRLPAEYRGAGAAGTPGEDDGAAAIVVAEWATFTEAERAAFLPYVVRPTDPASIYALPGTARSPFTLASTRGATTRGAATAPTRAAATTSGAPTSGASTTAGLPSTTAAVCEDGFLRETVPGIPVTVWGQCGGSTESRVLARVDEVLTYVAEVWRPMTDLMGEPIGDANLPDDDYPDAPEAGDGLLDIYVVAGSVGGRARPITTNALATTITAPPLAGPEGAETSSSYIVVDGAAGAGLALKSTLAHELFHSLQYAHNNLGTVLPSREDSGWDRHWFMEASATWAEHEFVPAARKTEVYPRIEAFQESSLGLASVRGANEYASWMWPFFMRQEEGPGAIGGAWLDLEGVKGYFELHRAIGLSVSFEDRFGDFAVRAYNLELEPGDPIDPRFQAADPAFPQEGPVDPRATWDVEIPVGDPVTFTTDMPALWTQVVDLVTDDAPTVTLDFAALLEHTDVSVDLLVKTKDGWQRRSGDIGPICDAERIVVVLANPNPGRGMDATGGWTAQGSADTCNDGNWTVTLTGGKNGAGTYSGRAETISCYEDQQGKWSFSADVDMAGDIRFLGGSEQNLHIITRWAMDDPIDWGAGFQRGSRIRVTGDKSSEPWTVHAEATWHDVATDNDLSSSVDVTCSEYFSMVP
jgi:hypothetical protein